MSNYPDKFMNKRLFRAFIFNLFKPINHDLNAMSLLNTFREILSFRSLFFALGEQLRAGTDAHHPC